MVRGNKRQARAREAPNVAAALGEARTQDDGFSFPLGENAEKTAAKYFCASPTCPGYGKPASELAHPRTTCGGILNETDSPEKHEENAVIEAPSKTDPANDRPDFLPPLPYGAGSGIIASTIAIANRVSQNVNEGIGSEDMPPVEDTGGVPKPLPSPIPKPHIPESGVGSTDMPPLDPAEHYEDANSVKTTGFDVPSPLRRPEEKERVTGFLASADDSPAAHGEESPDWEPAGEFLAAKTVPEPEKPTPPPIRIPRLVTDPRDWDHFLTLLSTKERVPNVGSWWAEPNRISESSHCYEITGINASEGFALCDIHLSGVKYECLVRLGHFINGDLAPFLTKPPFLAQNRAPGPLGVVLPFLPNPDARGLKASLPINTYIPKMGSWWLEDLPEPQTKAVYRVYAVDESVRPQRSGNDVAVKIYYQDGQEARDVLRFSRFLDGTLRFIPDAADLPEWAEISEPAKPHAPPPYTDPGEEPMDAVADHCRELAEELSVQPLHVARLVDGILATFLSVVTLKELANTSPVVVQLLERLKSPKVLEYLSMLVGIAPNTEIRAELDGQIDKIVEYVNKTIEPRIDALEGNPVVPLEQLEQLAAVAAELQETTAATAKLEKALLARMEKLETRQSLIEQQSKQVKSAMRVPPDERAVALRRARDQQNREKKRAAQRPSGVDIDEESEPLPNSGGRPIGSTVSTGAKPPNKKRQRRASKKSKKSVSTGGLVQSKPPSSSPPAKAKPKPAKAKPKASKPPKVAKAPKPEISPFVAFVGNAGNPKLMKQLERIVPSQREKFIMQAKKGLPDMRLTPWTSAEQGTFAQWYFTHRNALAKR